MGDDLDGLREVDEDRALTPPQDVESREVAVDAVDRHEHSTLVVQLVPYPLRDLRGEVDLRETRCRALAVADERHQVAVVQQLDRWWNGHAGFVETYQAVPLVRDPAGLGSFMAEPRVLLHRAALATRAPAPHAAIRPVVMERPTIARLETFFSEQGRSVAADTGDEMDLAFFARLVVALRRIAICTGGEPVS